jgi:acyl-CoA hydrolase
MAAQRVSLEAAAERLAAAARQGDGRVYVAGCSGAPLALHAAFAAAPELAAGLTFEGVWIPGVDKADWASLHEKSRAEGIFLSPEWQESFRAGRFCFSPLTYTQTWDRLARSGRAVAVVMTSLPDAEGAVSLGVSQDFSPAALEHAGLKIAVMNPAMPPARDGARLPLSSFDLVVEHDHPLLTVETPTLDPAFAAIAGHVRALLHDGDTLQFGLGKVQLAVLGALEGLRGLRLHAGMVSDPLLSILDGPVLADAPDAVTTGVALGSPALYARTACDPRVRFRAVGYTHAIATLGAIPQLVAVNSLIEVDLFGQGNAEFLGPAQISGGGGLTDFLRGAALSAQGRPVCALVSTAKGGALSRIVPRLAHGAVSVSRADMGIVVTEHGSADLRGLDVEARAQALIGLAAPAHRNTLAAAWREMRRSM